MASKRVTLKVSEMTDKEILFRRLELGREADTLRQKIKLLIDEDYGLAAEQNVRAGHPNFVNLFR